MRLNSVESLALHELATSALDNENVAPGTHRSEEIPCRDNAVLERFLVV